MKDRQVRMLMKNKQEKLSGQGLPGDNPLGSKYGPVGIGVSPKPTQLRENVPVLRRVSIGPLKKTGLMEFIKVGGQVYSRKWDRVLDDEKSDTSLAMAENGHLSIDNNFIMQWGVTGTITPGTPLVVPFSIPFPNACLSVVVSSSARDAYNVSTGTGTVDEVYTKTGFTIHAQARDDGPSNKAHYIAIGH